MPEDSKEKETTPLIPRRSLIMNEVLEEYVLQINEGGRFPKPHDDFRVESFEQLVRWAKRGQSHLVAATIAQYEIPDDKGKEILAIALENQAIYFQRELMRKKRKKGTGQQINWMKNAAKRLRGEEI